jgi:Na+/H+ antiporter NhaC
MKTENKKENQYVSIVAVTLGIFMVVSVLFLIFANDQLGILVPLSWAFVVMGIVAAAFASKKDKKK